jgi:hypothetical protein
MNFIFENLDNYENFISCNDTNWSGIKRFTASPIVTTMIRYQRVKQQFKNGSFSDINVSNNILDFDKYIISSGVAHSPYDWCGPSPVNKIGFDKRRPDRQNLFSFLSSSYLEDLRKNKAMLLLDQSHEGYHASWIFDWFHETCDFYNVNPSQIIYVTGNLDEGRQYKEWLKNKTVKGTLCIVPHAHFECMIYDTALNRVRIHNEPPLPTFIDQIQYKIKNKDAIKTYNALQKRPRAHRIWLFKELVDADLLDFGINSMNDFDFNHSYYMNKFLSKEEYDKIKIHLPMMPPADTEIDKFQAEDSGKYQLLFNEQITLDSWISVISEASFGEDTCFISEKTFKPIACFHPFIVYGNKNSLLYLKDLGYKTFSPYINETYDSLDTWERLSAIVKSIKEFNSKTPQEKLDAFLGMKDILIHNYKTLRKNSHQYIPKSMISIKEHFRKNYV